MTSQDLSGFKNKKIALVLSGGVIKAAAWHLGVAMALEELGFTLVSNKNALDDSARKRSLAIDTYVGSSAGSFIGILLASGFSPNEIISGVLGLNKSAKLKKLSYKDVFRYSHKRAKPPKSTIYHPLDHLPPPLQVFLKPFMGFSGFFTTDGVREYLINQILEEDTFESFIPDLFVVATQLDHSRKVIFSKYNYPNPSHDNNASYYTGTLVSEAAAASMSVPPIYSPYPIKNSQTGQIDYYIDGEIRETLSTHVAEDNHCDIAISSWTHTPYHYHDEVGSLINYGLQHIAIQSIYLMIQKKIVARRAQRATAIDIMNTVGEYMKSEKFSNKHRTDILAILERKLAIKSSVKLIDIYPDHSDYELFFASSFSMNPKVASHAVKSGYRRTIEVITNQEKF
jgi:predicted acylesterase/phospholipase RssA